MQRPHGGGHTGGKIDNIQLDPPPTGTSKQPSAVSLLTGSTGTASCRAVAGICATGERRTAIVAESDGFGISQILEELRSGVGMCAVMGNSGGKAVANLRKLHNRMSLQHPLIQR